MNFNVQKKIPSRVVTRARGCNSQHPTQMSSELRDCLRARCQTPSHVKVLLSFYGWWMTLPDRRPTMLLCPQGACTHTTLRRSSLPPFSNGLLRKPSSYITGFSEPWQPHTKTGIAFSVFNCAEAESAKGWHDAAMLVHVTLKRWWMRQVSYSRYRWDWWSLQKPLNHAVDSGILKRNQMEIIWFLPTKPRCLKGT